MNCCKCRKPANLLIVGRCLKCSGQRNPLEMTEEQFLLRVTSQAEDLGWKWIHQRPARLANGGWVTPVQGNGAKGWLDVTLWRGRRLIIAELKTDRGRVSADQELRLEELRQTPAEVYLWRPRDQDQIDMILA